MYLRVAHGACLVLSGLVVGRRYTRGREIIGNDMALQAERIHIAAGQQAWIRRSMRGMAGGATLRLYRGMFEDEWPSGLRMAFHAHRVLMRCRL